MVVATAEDVPAATVAEEAADDKPFWGMRN